MTVVFRDVSESFTMSFLEEEDSHKVKRAIVSLNQLSCECDGDIQSECIS